MTKPVKANSDDKKDRKKEQNASTSANRSDVPSWGWVLLAFFLLRLAFTKTDCILWLVSRFAEIPENIAVSGCFPCALAGLGILLWFNGKVQTNRRAFYKKVWLGAYLFWLSMTFFMTYPHWATSIGWLAISCALSLFIPIFLWLCYAAKQAKIPVWLAAPIIWTGLEWIQGHICSGYLMGQLALTLYDAPAMIQLAEWGGSYAVSFVIVLVAALTSQAFVVKPPTQLQEQQTQPQDPQTPRQDQQTQRQQTGAVPQNRLEISPFHLILAVAVVILVGGWGEYRLLSLEQEIADAQRAAEREELTGDSSSPSRLSTSSTASTSTVSTSADVAAPVVKKPLKVALLQGNVPCQVIADDSLIRRSFGEYCPLSEQALALAERKRKPPFDSVASSSAAQSTESEKPSNGLNSAESADNKQEGAAPKGSASNETVLYNDRILPSSDPVFASNPAAVDLLVWPESMYRYPLVSHGSKPINVPDGATISVEEYKENMAQYQIQFQAGLDALSCYYQTAFLTGIDNYYVDGDQEKRYNSAILVTPKGRIANVYSKRHCVPFGEFIPFADYFPFLKKITPVGQGTTPGVAPVAMAIWPHSALDPLFGDLSTAGQADSAPSADSSGIAQPTEATSPGSSPSFKADAFSRKPITPWIIVPSICYENTLPHVTRRQVSELRAKGIEPDVLVNISNDGWFKGGFEADFRLACSVFRAVEMRKTQLCASNGGLAAHISPTGRIITCGTKGHYSPFSGGVRSEFIRATIPYMSFQSLYSQVGDIFALVCLFLTGILTLYGLLKPLKSTKPLL